MKIYEDRVAPNPRRVRVFLAEKGITDVEFVAVSIGEGGILTPEFLRRNPLAQVPVLELDDGSYLTESVAICRYFEYLQPKPALFGEPGLDMARVEMWNRRMEFEVFWPIANVFRHIHPFFKGKHPQLPEYGEVCRAHALRVSTGWMGNWPTGGRSSPVTCTPSPTSRPCAASILAASAASASVSGRIWRAGTPLFLPGPARRPEPVLTPAALFRA